MRSRGSRRKHWRGMVRKGLSYGAYVLMLLLVSWAIARFRLPRILRPMLSPYSHTIAQLERTGNPPTSVPPSRVHVRELPDPDRYLRTLKQIVRLLDEGNRIDAGHTPTRFW